MDIISCEAGVVETLKRRDWMSMQRPDSEDLCELYEGVLLSS